MEDDGAFTIDDDENVAVAEDCRRKDDVVAPVTLRNVQTVEV